MFSFLQDKVFKVIKKEALRSPDKGIKEGEGKAASMFPDALDDLQANPLF